MLVLMLFGDVFDTGFHLSFILLFHVKAGNKQWISVTYTPEIYLIFKVPKDDHPWYEQKRYTLKKLHGTPLYTESKTNEIKHSHRYKRFFASVLRNVNKKTTNININNDRDNQWNQI